MMAMWERARVCGKEWKGSNVHTIRKAYLSFLSLLIFFCLFLSNLLDGHLDWQGSPRICQFGILGIWYRFLLFSSHHRGDKFCVASRCFVVQISFNSFSLYLADLVFNRLPLFTSHFGLGDMVGHLSPPPAPLPVAGASAPSSVAAAAGAAVAPAPVGLRVKSRLKSSERGAPRLLPPLGDEQEEGGPLTNPERPVRRLVRKWQVQSINNESTSTGTGREKERAHTSLFYVVQDAPDAAALVAPGLILLLVVVGRLGGRGARGQEPVRGNLVVAVAVAGGRERRQREGALPLRRGLRICPCPPCPGRE